VSVRIDRVVNDLPSSKAIDRGITVGGFSTLDEVQVEAPVIIGRLCTVKRVSLGRFFACGEACSAVDVRFGSFVSVGDRVSFNAGMHPKDRLTTHLFPYNRAAWGDAAPTSNETWTWRVPQTIGSDVWVGSNAVVRTGVSVGHGAIVGANTFVNADVPPYAICAGSPGRVVGYRFEPDIIERLLRVSWWDRPLADLEGLPFSDVHRCLAMLEAAP
jgi:acetyltransferase-like isoleucine patch superfamily enzyme